MALVNSIVIDLGAKTASLTSTSSGSPVETITYSFSSNQVTFNNRSLINILGTDFLTLIAQVNLLQAAILSNFPVIQYANVPFTEVQNVQTNLVSSNQWNYYCVTSYSPTGRIIDYSALGSNTTVNLNNRQFSMTINYPEWIYILQALNYYNVGVKSFFNL